jgi:hypothetical protein
MEKIESVAFSYKTTLFDLRQHLKTVADCKTKKIKKKFWVLDATLPLARPVYGRYTAVGASSLWTLHFQWRIQDTRKNSVSLEIFLKGSVFKKKKNLCQVRFR